MPKIYASPIKSPNSSALYAKRSAPITTQESKVKPCITSQNNNIATNNIKKNSNKNNKRSLSQTPSPQKPVTPNPSKKQTTRDYHDQNRPGLLHDQTKTPNTQSIQKDQTTSRMANESTDQVFRYEGQNFKNFLNPFKFAQEMKSHFPTQKIDRAFINSKNNQLYIITSNDTTKKYIENYSWPPTAFGGIKTYTPKERKYTLAIHNVDTSLDPQEIITTNSDLKDCTIKRIHKKLNQTATTTLQLTTTNKSLCDSLISNKLQIHYSSYVVTEWKFEPRPLQCHKCNKYNHNTKSCPEPNPTCPICSETHTLENCTNKTNKVSIKCANCPTNNKHTAFSKNCPLMIQATNKMKIIKTTPTTNPWLNRTHATAPTEMEHNQLDQSTITPQNTTASNQATHYNPTTQTSKKQQSARQQNTLSNTLTAELNEILTILTTALSNRNLETSTLQVLKTTLKLIIERLNEL